MLLKLDCIIFRELNDGINSWNSLDKTSWFERNHGQIILTTVGFLLLQPFLLLHSNINYTLSIYALVTFFFLTV